MDINRLENLCDDGYTIVIEGEDSLVSCYIKWGDEVVAEGRKHRSVSAAVIWAIENFAGVKDKPHENL